MAIRINVVPFLFGILCGVVLFKLLTHHSLTFDRPIRLTCLTLVRGKTACNANKVPMPWLTKCDDMISVQIRRRNQKNASFPTEIPCLNSSFTVIEGGSAYGGLCQALHLLPRPLEWLVIAPETLLLVVENLKHLVRGEDWTEPKYFGHPIHSFMTDYNVLSAGILLSNGSVERLLKEFPDYESCEKGGKYWNNEDLYLGVNLAKLGITVEDTRDAEGRGRFHGFNINTMLFPGNLFRRTNYFRKALYPIHEGFNCCSSQLVTMETSDADHALLQYFLMYGIGKKGIPLSHPEHLAEDNKEDVPVWVKALREIGYNGPVDSMTPQQYYNIWNEHVPPHLLQEQLKQMADENL